MEDYPNKLIRGLSNPNDLDDEGSVSVSFFIFQENQQRTDNKKELSINWCDDKSKALSIAMNQTKGDGSLQFKVGVAVLSRGTLDMLKKSYQCKGKLDYERAPIENNEFHGNITCVTGLKKPIENLIRAALVLSVTSVITREQ